jgi:ribosomal protein S18 acetylase RimI-like enzyme
VRSPLPAPDGAAGRAAARGIVVRPATEDDLGAIVELRLALLREHQASPIYGRVRRDAPARARRLFLAQLRSPGEITLLAERRGEVVGILRCLRSGGHPLLHPDAYGYVSSVYVHPGVRRAGVLKSLVAAAEDWCREHGLDELRLHNSADNPLANAAWEALGFRVVEHLRMRRID